MEDQWILIPNWGKFQHYKDRVPLWIKVYLELRSRDEWDQLSFAERGLLVSIWVEYAASDGQIRTRSLQHRFGHRVRIDSLERLSHAGFIELVAIKPVELRYQAASTHARRERREEKRRTPLPPHSGGTKRTNNTNPRATSTNPRANANTAKEQAHTDLLTKAAELADTWTGTDSAEFDQTLDQLEHDLHARLTAVERDDLWEKAFSLGF